MLLLFYNNEAPASQEPKHH